MSRHYITYLISLLSLLALPAFGQDPFKPVATDGDRIVLTTAIERADDITFVIRPIEHGIWVDQNGDGQFQREEMASNPEDDLNDPGHFLVTFQVTSPQITIYGKIDQLIIPDCKMTSVDLTHATALKTLEAYRNEISSVTTSAGLPLEDLWLADNKLQEIDFSNWSKLCFIELYNNQISEQAMTKAFNTLQQAAPVSDPELDIPEPTIQVIDTHSEHEGNVCNVDAVAHARHTKLDRKALRWFARGHHAYLVAHADLQPYAWSDQTRLARASQHHHTLRYGGTHATRVLYVHQLHHDPLGSRAVCYALPPHDPVA